MDVLNIFDHELKVDASTLGLFHRFGMPWLPTSIQGPMGDHDLGPVQGQVGVGILSASLSHCEADGICIEFYRFLEVTTPQLWDQGVYFKCHFFSPIRQMGLYSNYSS